MTIDLNEHMEKKSQERRAKAYDAIGEVVNGMTILDVLRILSAFSLAVLNEMDDPERSEAVKTFSSIIAQSVGKPTGTVQ